MDCPICRRLGEGPQGRCFVRCRAFGHKAVCIRHCMACRYHRERCSIDWCGWRPAEEKRREG